MPDFCVNLRPPILSFVVWRFAYNQGRSQFRGKTYYAFSVANFYVSSQFKLGLQRYVFRVERGHI